MAGCEGADYARKQIAASTTGENGTARDVDHFAFARADAGERPLEDGHAAELARIGSRAKVRSACEAGELTRMRSEDESLGFRGLVDDFGLQGIGIEDGGAVEGLQGFVQQDVGFPFGS